ncbi:MAG: DUF4321 domain-containing protein [Ethanoligenens sp.]
MRSVGKSGNVFLLIVFLILAIVAGGVIAAALQQFPWAGFLTYTKTFGIGDTQPVTLDLSVLRVSFGLGLRINLTQVLCILAAILIYRKIN